MPHADGLTKTALADATTKERSSSITSVAEEAKLVEKGTTRYARSAMKLGEKLKLACPSVFNCCARPVTRSERRKKSSRKALASTNNRPWSDVHCRKRAKSPDEYESQTDTAGIYSSATWACRRKNLAVFFPAGKGCGK